MTRGRIVAFLNGQLSEADEQAFDEHLLSCEECWRAVREDRAARLALERLRVPAPPGLADRVTVSVGLASPSRAESTASARSGPLGRAPLFRVGLGRPGRMLVGAALGLALDRRPTRLGADRPPGERPDPDRLGRCHDVAEDGRQPGSAQR